MKAADTGERGRRDEEGAEKCVDLRSFTFHVDYDAGGPKRVCRAMTPIVVSTVR